MNKNFLSLYSLILFLCFSTGIFVEIMSPERAVISSEASTFWSSLLAYCQTDISTVFLAFFFSMTVVLIPCTLMLVCSKVFSLGFSAAYLLSTHEQGLVLLLMVLFPRAMLKLPLYVALIWISFDMAKSIKKKTHGKAAWKQILYRSGKRYGLCLFLLMFSSLIEACLLQAIL